MITKEDKEIKDTEQAVYEKCVKDAKKKYKKVYQTIISDEKIIWRTLKRSEYKEIMALGEENKDLSDRELLYLREEAVAKKVILYPSDVNELLEDIAAIAEIISTECMDKSGFNSMSETTKL